jgi:hypothetical protein
LPGFSGKPEARVVSQKRQCAPGAGFLVPNFEHEIKIGGGTLAPETGKIGLVERIGMDTGFAVGGLARVIDEQFARRRVSGAGRSAQGFGKQLVFVIQRMVKHIE